MLRVPPVLWGVAVVLLAASTGAAQTAEPPAELPFDSLAPQTSDLLRQYAAESHNPLLNMMVEGQLTAFDNLPSPETARIKPTPKASEKLKASPEEVVTSEPPASSLDCAAEIPCPCTPMCLPYAAPQQPMCCCRRCERHRRKCCKCCGNCASSCCAPMTCCCPPPCPYQGCCGHKHRRKHRCSRGNEGCGYGCGCCFPCSSCCIPSCGCCMPYSPPPCCCCQKHCRKHGFFHKHCCCSGYAPSYDGCGCCAPCCSCCVPCCPPPPCCGHKCKRKHKCRGDGGCGGYGYPGWCGCSGYGMDGCCGYGNSCGCNDCGRKHRFFHRCRCKHCCCPQPAPCCCPCPMMGSCGGMDGFSFSMDGIGTMTDGMYSSGCCGGGCSSAPMLAGAFE